MSADTMRRAREVRQAQRIATRDNRRALVRQFRREGLDAYQVLARLTAWGWRVSLVTVYRDITALEGPLPRRGGGWRAAQRTRAQVARRRLRDRRRRVVVELMLWQLRDRGEVDATAITRRLQVEGWRVSETTVRRDVRALKLHALSACVERGEA